MMRLLYSLSISLYAATIKIAAVLGNSKAKLWVLGRKKWKAQLKSVNPQKRELIWIHAASLGEFEQARPVIEQLKEKVPNDFILLSFFSPSGFEVMKNYSYADKVIYLPIDLKKNATHFLNLTNPKKALFIKYEFWFNYLLELKNREIPTFLVSGIFRPNQHFFKFFGVWFREQLSAFHHFFVQNKESQQLLSSIGYENTTITGDTRLDRVIKISKTPFSDQRFESFSDQHKVIVFGSSWEAEHKLIKQLINVDNNFKIIIAPHEINQEKTLRLKAELGKNTQLLSEIGQDLSALKVLIVDQVGLLSKIYRYAHLAFIGGGFGSGIHNLLEASVYGCPVIFGPNYRKFQEAKDLIQSKAGFSVNSFKEFNSLLETLEDKTFYQTCKTEALEYVLKNSGATKKVVQKITS